MDIILGRPEHRDPLIDMICRSHLGDIYFESDRSYLEDVIGKALDEENMLLAIEEDHLQGFLWFDLKGAFRIHAYVHLQLVDSDHAGKGVGRALMEAFEEAARAISEKAFLAVAEFNHSALTFYEHLGYKNVGVIPGLYRDGVGEHLLMKVFRKSKRMQ